MRCSESNRANRAASITTQPKRCGQDVASRPASATARPWSSAPPDAKHEAPIAACQPLRGAVLRRTRRVDGVRVDGSSARRRPSAAQCNTVDRSCPRDTHGSARGCPRRPGARRRRAGVGWRPAVALDRRWPLNGAVLDVSPVAPRNDLDAVRNSSESKKKPPTAVILGNEVARPTQTANGPRPRPRPSPRTGATSPSCARG